jgi:hypothetical protein
MASKQLRLSWSEPVCPSSGYTSMSMGSALFGHAEGTLPSSRATHYEGVLVRCSRIQGVPYLHVRRLPLVAIVGC